MSRPAAARAAAQLPVAARVVAPALSQAPVAVEHPPVSTPPVVATPVAAAALPAPAPTLSLDDLVARELLEVTGDTNRTYRYRLTETGRARHEEIFRQLCLEVFELHAQLKHQLLGVGGGDVEAISATSAVGGTSVVVASPIPPSAKTAMPQAAAIASGSFLRKAA